MICFSMVIYYHGCLLVADILVLVYQDTNRINNTLLHLCRVCSMFCICLSLMKSNEMQVKGFFGCLWGWVGGFFLRKKFRPGNKKKESHCTL